MERQNESLVPSNFEIQCEKLQEVSMPGNNPYGSWLCPLGLHHFPSFFFLKYGTCLQLNDISVCFLPVEF